MRHGDKYKHCKGNEYIFWSIALPMDKIQFNTENLEHVGTVRYHEDTHDIDIYQTPESVYFINSDVPFVLYQSVDKTIRRLWAREIDDYFGYRKNPDNQMMEKRFELIEKRKINKSTFVRLLPDDIITEIESELEEKGMNLDEIDQALDSRLSDLADVININKYIAKK